MKEPSTNSGNLKKQKATESPRIELLTSAPAPTVFLVGLPSWSPDKQLLLSYTALPDAFRQIAADFQSSLTENALPALW